MRIIIMRALIAAALFLTSSAVAETVPDFDLEGPFREGEGFGIPATCETISNWIDRVPDYDGRISMTITGVIVESHWDGALAYLIMCDPQDIQIMCVTYHPEEVTGETVLFAGGYNRVGDKQIALDPCLVYPGDGTLDRQ